MIHLSIGPDYRPEALIVAHGALEQDATMTHLVQEAAHVVVCDGALQEYSHLFSRRPDVVIGDGDSVDETLLEDLGMQMIRIEEQETNDLTKAVNYAIKCGWRTFCLIGATGKREDHAIGNISHMVDFFHLEEVDDVRMYSPHGWMIPFNGGYSIQLEKGRQLSFFAPKSAHLTAEGVAYPFRNRQFERLWQSTLNEALGGEVTCTSTETALIYIANQIKQR